MSDNQRKYARAAINDSAYSVFITNSENKKFKVQAKDVSKGGIGIIAESYDCYDEEFLVEIKSASKPDDDLFFARGSVRWIQEEQGGGVAFGIQFDYLDDEMENILQGVLENCETC